MHRQKSRDWNCHAIAHRAVSVVVRAGQLKIVVCAHQSRAFSSGQQSGSYFSAVDDQNNLSAAAAVGGAQTAGQAVESQLQPLRLAIAISNSRASIPCTYEHVSGSNDGIQ